MECTFWWKQRDEAVHLQAWRSRRMTRRGWRGAQSLHRGNPAWWRRRRRRMTTRTWISMRTGVSPQRMWAMKKKRTMTTLSETAK